METAVVPFPIHEETLLTPCFPVEDDPCWPGTEQSLDELQVEYDSARKILWWFMTPKDRPSFTRGLLEDMHTFGDGLEDMIRRRNRNVGRSVRYLVLGSKLSGIFNLGGNLDLFLSLINRGDHESLRTYARSCAIGQHRIADRFGLPICTIALVQGDALGGGFEAALANDIIVAERSAKFGLPEILFGMFPGMGAYSFLSRRINHAAAENMILSGRMYSAEELQGMGVVDVVAEDGLGREAVYDYVARNDKVWGAKRALLQAKSIVNPVSRKELIDIVEIWVERAMSLSDSELRRMRHLAKAQDRRWLKNRLH